LRKTRILVVSSPALSNVIHHLFRDRSEFEIVGRVNGLGALKRHTESLDPELIVADVKPLRTRLSRAVSVIKQHSPLSKLIMICPIRELIGEALTNGADACVEQEKLIHHLLPAARALADFPRPALLSNSQRS